MNKKSTYYDDGVFLTRAQPPTRAHMKCLAQIAEGCERILVIIGSANKKGTLRNPFSIGLRKELMGEAIAECFPGEKHRFNIVSLDDYSYANNPNAENAPKWGQYLYDFIVKQIRRPDFAYYTGEMISASDSWFASTTGAEYITTIWLSVTGEPISATLTRKALEKNDRATFEKCCPGSVSIYYELLRGLYLQVLEKPKEDFSKQEG